MNTNQGKSSWRYRLWCTFPWVLVVGVALGWWFDHRRSTETADLLKQKVHYWSFTDKLIEAGLANVGFTIQRKVTEHEDGRRGIEYSFTNSDGKTFESGAIVIDPGIDEMPEEDDKEVIHIVIEGTGNNERRYQY